MKERRIDSSEARIFLPEFCDSEKVLDKNSKGERDPAETEYCDTLGLISNISLFATLPSTGAISQ